MAAAAAAALPSLSPASSPAAPSSSSSATHTSTFLPLRTQFLGPLRTSIARFSLPISVVKRQTVAPRALIAPDGGELVELLVAEHERAGKQAEAEALPRVSLTPIDLEWVHVVSEGWASPLRGFMRQAEYLQALHFNSFRLADGSLVNMSIPIVLAINDLQKEAIASSSSIALQAPSGNLIAILHK